MPYIIPVDVETTISNKGNPFDTTNKMVLGGYGAGDDYNTFTPNNIAAAQEAFDRAELILFFNAKFDLHWCRNVGIKFGIRLPIWDCQLAEFILSNQRIKYPALDTSCERRGLPGKLDVVKTEYWEKGIDTDAIPIDILSDYLRQDLNATYQLYLAQVAEFKKPEHAGKYKLFRMGCYDLLTLQEMEYNGFVFDVEAATKAAEQLEQQCAKLDQCILDEFVDVPINLSSPDHVSCMLYGGTITESVQIPIGVYKTGARVGHPKYKKIDKPYTLTAIVTPLKGTELAKEGYYGTSEAVLQSLKGDGKAKRIIDALLMRRTVEKLRGTYYAGIPNLIQNLNWAASTIHGQLNQCVASTGRLSASKPNQQNMPPDCKRFCISRYV